VKQDAEKADHTRKVDNLTPLRSMLLQRRFEERTAEAYALGKIGGFCHLYIGQEAVSTGTLSVLRPDDYIITTYRDHGQALARGMAPRAIMAELFGKVDGCSRGKGGSMHLFDRNLNFLGGHGIVGGHVPVATGVGFAIKYRGGDQVCVCFMGESVVNTGAFHEALNMAGLWKLPVVYIIENNRYGMGTSLDRASSVKDLYQRASAYGIPRCEVNGMDILAMRQAVDEAIQLARKEKRPTLIEAETYRYRGHSMSDPGKYRTKEEVESMMRHDPILQFGKWLIEKERFTQADLDALDREIIAQIDDAQQFVEKSPDPTPESLYEDVYVKSPYINLKAAEKDPAWQHAVAEDRVPEQHPAFVPPASAKVEA
jgi:pyruvate dehydrogenase E1 component alpha subunit